MTRAPRATVVVPTRDRPHALSRCLAALRGQTIASDLELLVVDDASIDPVVLPSGGGRLVRHPTRRGPAAARNTGAAAASAPAVLFTDDDCEPVPVWAEELVGRLEGGSDAVAGPTVNARPADALAEASQLVANALVRPGCADGAVAFAPSSNLGCRRGLIESLPFDEAFADAAGEDRDWCARLAAAGYELGFAPAAVVRHHQELDLSRFWNQHVRYGRASRLVRARHPDAVAGGAAVTLELVRAGSARSLRTGALVALSQVATAWGYARARARR